MADVEDRLDDPWFVNWVKSALTLDIAKRAVINFVEDKNIQFHKSVLSRISGGCTNPTNCAFDNRSSCVSCSSFKTAIKDCHRFNRSSFGNATIQDCRSNPWEFATCFMSPNGYKDVHSVTATDFSGIISVIINNKEFQQFIPENLSILQNSFWEAREVRNRIMHNPLLEVDEQAFRNNSGTIIQMLNNVPNTHVAVSKINELINGTMVIATTDIVGLVEEANKSLKLLNETIQLGLGKIKSITEICERKLKDETTKGVEVIDKKVTEGEAKLEEKTTSGVAVIQHATEEGSKIIDDKTKSASTNLSMKKEEGLNAIALKAHRIKEELTLADQALQKDKEQLQGVVQGGMHDLEIKIKEIVETKKDTDNVREELETKTALIDNRTTENVQKLQNVTEACMERLCTETATFGQILKSRSEKENTHGEDITSIQRKLMELDKKLETSLSKVTQLEAVNDERSDVRHQSSQEESLGRQISTKEKVALLNTFDIRDETEADCMITGMVVVTKEILAIADNKNKSVKLINVKRNVITAHVNLPSEPWDITRVHKNHLAVSCGHKLQFLQLDYSLSISEKVLELQGDCRGVEYARDSFVVSFVAPEKEVQIISTEGDVLMSYTHDGHGKPLFDMPLYIKLSADKQIIFVSDYTTSKVIRLNLDGAVQNVYTHAKLKSPFGLTVDLGGTLYITGWRSNNLHHINASCEHMDILLDKELHCPQSIAYCEDENKLYVGNQANAPKNNTIACYQL